MLLMYIGSLDYLYSIKYSYVNFLFVALFSSKINIHNLNLYFKIVLDNSSKLKAYSDYYFHYHSIIVKTSLNMLESFYCQLFSFINSLFIIYVNMLFYYANYIKLLFNRYFLFSMFFASHYTSYGLGINNALYLMSFVIMFTHYTKRKCLKVYLCLYIIMKTCNAGYFSNMKLLSWSLNTFSLGGTLTKVKYIFIFSHYG